MKTKKNQRENVKKNLKILTRDLSIFPADLQPTAGKNHIFWKKKMIKHFENENNKTLKNVLCLIVF